MLQTLFVKAIPYLAVTAVVLFLGSCVHQNGVKQGKSEVQAEWDKDTKKREAVVAKLKAEYEDKERSHRNEVDALQTALAKASTEYAAALARNNAEWVGRLRNSETRSATYQHMSQSGPTQCASLANHAAKLDLALTGGISLVERLRATIKLRDEELITLARQINADRSLIGTKK